MIFSRMRKSSIVLFAVLACASTASASVFLGGVNDVKASPFVTQRSSCMVTNFYRQKSLQDKSRTQEMAQTVRRTINPTTKGAAMAIPGYGIAEQVFVGGFGNFLSIFNIVITGRVLLSWFPQAQGIAILQPIFQITDPYLNLFRGLIPPIFGLDLSPILAFVLLNVLTSVTASVGAEITPDDRKKLQQSSPFVVKPYYDNKKNKARSPQVTKV